MKRLSPLDGVLIFLLIIGLIGAVWRMGKLREAPAEEAALVTLVQRRVYFETADLIKTGDLLYNSAGEYWGAVETVVIQPARVMLWNGGEFYEGGWEEGTLCDVWVTVHLTGTWRDGRFLEKGRTPLSIGSSRTLGTSSVILQGSVEKVVSGVP